MKLVDSIYQSIHQYPGLFYYIGHPTLTDFEISRLSVLEHLFMTNGNGYCWVDGYLCSTEDAEEQDFDPVLGWVAKGPAYGALTYTDRTFPPARTYSTKPNHRDEPKTPDLFAWEYVKSWNEHSFGKKIQRPPQWPFSIYEVSDYYTLKMPDFVQPDWLQGAKDICEFAIQAFLDTDCPNGNNERIPFRTRSKSWGFLKKRLKEINARIANGGRL